MNETFASDKSFSGDMKNVRWIFKEGLIPPLSLVGIDFWILTQHRYEGSCCCWTSMPSGSWRRKFQCINQFYLLGLESLAIEFLNTYESHKLWIFEWIKRFLGKFWFKKSQARKFQCINQFLSRHFCFLDSALAAFLKLLYIYMCVCAVCGCSINSGDDDDNRT